MKVRAGFYRCGPFCIHGGNGLWGVYRGPKYISKFRTLREALTFCERAG